MRKTLSDRATANALKAWDETAKHIPTMASNFKAAFYSSVSVLFPAVTKDTIESMYQKAFAMRT